MYVLVSFAHDLLKLKLTIFTFIGQRKICTLAYIRVINKEWFQEA